MPARPAGRLPPPPELAGTWLGTFWQDKEDGSYTSTWTTRVVAGSSRGGSQQLEGFFAVDGDRVVLTDGRRLTLRPAGDSLYGITVDPGSGRTIQVCLERAARRS